MAGFKSPLIVKPCSHKMWRLVESLEYKSDLLGDDSVILVPANFPTDFASIPRYMWWLLTPFSPEYAAAAALHDWLYSVSNIDRKLADDLMLEAMASQNVTTWKRSLMYRAVRVFGERYRYQVPGRELNKVTYLEDDKGCR